MASTEASSGTPSMGVSTVTAPQDSPPTSTSQEPPESANENPTPRDLWGEALKKLKHEDQRAMEELQATTASQESACEKMDALLKLTDDVKAKCVRKKFRFRGKEYIARDVVGKIAFWIDKFKGVGDVAINFDPAHAALPWAGVRFLLLVC